MERHAVIAAGFGFRKGAGVAALHAALVEAQRGHPSITVLAAPEDKLDLPALLAETLGLTLIPIPPDLLRTTPTATQSLASRCARGTGSVAEAAALAAVGAGGRLIVRRQISPDRMATCAIAQGPPA